MQLQAMPGGGMISISAYNADVAAVNVAGLPRAAMCDYYSEIRGVA
jgi:hypothetical protein